MMALKLIAILCLWFYGGLLFYAAIGFLRTRIFSSIPQQINKTKISVIVCARNESSTIEKCLEGITTQNFNKSLLEIIFVNDASEDDTMNKAEKILSVSGISYEVINHLEKTGKKKCISDAVGKSRGDLLILRDADTYTNNQNWLKSIVDFYEITQKEFIISPLLYENENGLLSQLQYNENAALSVIGTGFAHFKKPFLCSGANLAFTKKIFLDCNGFQSHSTILSGDDVLFLEDVKKRNPASIGVLKSLDAAVITYPEKTAQNLINQKIRWASKFNANPNKTNTYLGILVVIIHLFSLIALILPVFRHHFPYFGVIFVFSRLVIDYLLLFLASRYFRQPVKIFWLLPLSLFYSFYAIITGIASLFAKPNWK